MWEMGVKCLDIHSRNILKLQNPLDPIHRLPLAIGSGLRTDIINNLSHDIKFLGSLNPLGPPRELQCS